MEGDYPDDVDWAWSGLEDDALDGIRDRMDNTQYSVMLFVPGQAPLVHHGSYNVTPSVNFIRRQALSNGLLIWDAQVTRRYHGQVEHIWSFEAGTHIHKVAAVLHHQDDL